MIDSIMEPLGYVRYIHTAKTKSGIELPLSRSIIDVDGFKPLNSSKWNLVVNSGRQVLARALGGYYQTSVSPQAVPHVNRLIIGNGTKTDNLPSLADTGLVNEIQTLDGTPRGTFLIKGPYDASPEISFPAASQKYPLVSGYSGPNATITINGDEETILEDLTVNFIDDIGVTVTDQITINESDPLVFGIREVRSNNQLVLHNPYGYTGTAIEWKVGTPGTQMLVSKLLRGNDFSLAEYGGFALIHEAGLLFNNNTLFNRVVFAPNDEESGLLLQSDELSSGVEISVRIEWLVTF